MGRGALRGRRVLREIQTTWRRPRTHHSRVRSRLKAQLTPVGAVGRWVSDSEFLLDLDTVANVNHFLFNVRLDGDRVHLQVNETTGEMKNVAVEGVALKR